MRDRTGMLTALFFLSGLASLADEVVWFKYLTLTFGATTSATATLLAVFMGGLALGSAWAGRLSPRLRRPTLLYAVLEAGVGAYAVATPALFRAVDAGYVFAYRHLGHGPAALTAIRIALSAAALLPPTVLMGATFPALSRQVERGSLPGGRTGLLYGANTGGAVAGTALTAFLSIPEIGLHATLAASACASFLAALGAGLLAPSPPPHPEEAPARVEPRWTVVALLCGFSAMAAEVIWTRILVLHLGSSVYSFAAMLTVYLAGVAGGGAWGAVRRPGDLRRALSAALGLLAVSVAVQVFAFLLFKKALVFTGYDLLHAASFSGLLASRLLVTALYLLPPTFLMGASFALLLRLAAPSASRASEGAGRIYAANTVGGIVGALAAGFAGIPAIGSQNTLFAAAGIWLAASLATLPSLLPARAAVPLLALAAWLAPRDGVILSAGVFADYPRRDILFYDEGVTATVAVKKIEGPRPWLSLELNGVNVAGTQPDLIVTQKLQAHLPLSLADHARTVVHIGVGSGGTAYAASLHPVTRLNVVEISPEVPAAADRFFRGVNHGVLEDPRVRLTINDGRNFLLGEAGRFDAILSDSIHPRYAGNGSLYTEDYFRLCARRLAPGGVISMWLPMYSLLPENYKAIVRAFIDVFPNVSIWYPHETESSFTIVLATPHPTVDLHTVAARLSTPAVAADLAKIGDSSPADVLSDFIMGPADVARWAAGTPPHTDDLPVVEYESGRTIRNVGTWAATFADLLAHRSDIRSFVEGISPNDPLGAAVISRAKDAGPILARHLRDVLEEARREP